MLVATSTAPIVEGAAHPSAPTGHRALGRRAPGSALVKRDLRKGLKIRDAGLVVGGALGAAPSRGFRSFFDWISGADWTSMPATVAGTTIPAVDGFIFARSLAENSVRSLKNIELDEELRHARGLEAQAATEAVERARAWDRLHDACKAVDADAQSGEFQPLVAEVRAVVKADHEAAIAQAEAAGLPKPKRDDDYGGALASSRVVFPIVFGRRLPAVVAALSQLVEIHGVQRLYMACEEVDRVLQITSDPRHWLPQDVEAIRRAHHARRPGTDALGSVTYVTDSTVRYLAHLADRYRVVPHDAVDVDTRIERQTYGRAGASTEVIDVLATVRVLADSIDRYLEEQASP